MKRYNPKYKAKDYIDYLKTLRHLVKNTIDEDLFQTLDNQAKELSGFDKNQE